MMIANSQGPITGTAYSGTPRAGHGGTRRARAGSRAAPRSEAHLWARRRRGRARPGHPRARGRNRSSPRAGGRRSRRPPPRWPSPSSRSSSRSGSHGKSSVDHAAGSSSIGWNTLTVRLRRLRPREWVGAVSCSKASGRRWSSQERSSGSVSHATRVGSAEDGTGSPSAAASCETWRIGVVVSPTTSDGTIGRPASAQRCAPSPRRGCRATRTRSPARQGTPWPPCTTLRPAARTAPLVPFRDHRSREDRGRRRRRDGLGLRRAARQRRARGLGGRPLAGARRRDPRARPAGRGRERRPRRPDPGDDGRGRGRRGRARRHRDQGDGRRGRGRGRAPAGRAGHARALDPERPRRPGRSPRASSARSGSRSASPAASAPRSSSRATRTTTASSWSGSASATAP